MTATQHVALAVAEGRGEIDAAQQEAAEAKQLVTALEESVRSGDPAVGPAELIQAREVARIATLRVEAAQRRAEQMTTEARHRVYREYGADLVGERRTLEATETGVLGAYGQAYEALAELWRLTEEHAAHHGRLARARSTVLEIARQHGEMGMLPEAVASRPAAPPAEVAALPLERLLAEKLAEHRLNGGHYPPWSQEYVHIRAKRGAAAFPALATPQVEVLVARIRRDA